MRKTTGPSGQQYDFQPHMHRYGEDGDLECIETTGGLATALRPILATTKRTWNSHGAGNADRDTMDELDCLALPPGNPSNKLRRVSITGSK